jgi:hypothetical protein
VKRHVFDKLQQHPAVVPFKNDIGLPQELDPHMRTYYDTDVREGRYYSEDWTFCENWRDLGGKVWVDKRVLLRHTGTYTFDYQTQQPLYEALKREIEANAVPPAPEPEIVADSTVDLSHLPPERQSAKVLAKTKTVPKEEVSLTQDS